MMTTEKACHCETVSIQYPLVFHTHKGATLPHLSTQAPCTAVGRTKQVNESNYDGGEES
uniref:Uncharacterized protein n=1 Tax=Anguilla anguilla TaxID=7936 RepID=A0A0E9W3D9_ANGAN